MLYKIDALVKVSDWNLFQTNPKKSFQFYLMQIYKKSIRLNPSQCETLNPDQEPMNPRSELYGLIQIENSV